jgi:hypothetical protein
MLFDYDLFPAIRDGSITLTFRRWRRAQARAGSRHRFDADGVLAITAVELVRADEISDADARRAGHDGRAALLAGLERHGGPLTPDERIYRIEFAYEREADARTMLAAHDELSDEDAATIAARLAKMDAASAHGAWTAATLALIEAHPGVVSTHLAHKAGRERLAFKQDVRKLKQLGLTLSLEVGYELSPRGRAYLAHRRRSENVSG